MTISYRGVTKDEIARTLQLGEITRVEVLQILRDYVDLLLALDLSGSDDDKRDKLIENVALVSRMIVLNALKENTEALKEATARLLSSAEELKGAAQDINDYAGVLKRSLGALNALLSVVKFVP